MVIRKRQKASDIFRETNLVFSEKVSFEVAFPTIKNLSVHVEHYGHGITRWNKDRYYNKDNQPGEYIDCSNPLCYNGGFSIGSILREMIRNNEIEKIDSLLCDGNEGSPKGRRIYRKCMNMFKIRIKLEYIN